MAFLRCLIGGLLLFVVNIVSYANIHLVRDINGIDTFKLEKIYLEKNLVAGKNILKQSMLSKPNTLYVITHHYDLNGDTINVPEGCILYFAKGIIKHGWLQGTNTRIAADSCRIFENIHINGTWQVNRIYSNWFDFKDDGTDNVNNFRNMMSLANSSIFSHIYISNGTYYTSTYSRDKDGKYKGPDAICVPSNVHVHNSGMIRALPNNYGKTSVFYLNDVENVIIEGGTIIGDIQNHIGTAGEWGYGISLNGARNVTIRNIELREHWGDGINIQSLYSDYINKSIEGHCRDIVIENVKCLNNRRQGMSIEGCIGCKIYNSEFSGTGSIKYTAPGAGIDIEPWYPQQVVANISIDKCRFFNNKSYLTIINNTTNLNGISVKNCYSDRGIRIQASNVYVENFNAMTDMGYLSFFDKCNDITIVKSQFGNEIYAQGQLNNVTLEECIFKISEKAGTWSGFTVSFSQTSQGDASYYNIRLKNNIFKDINKLRFLFVDSKTAVKIDLIGNYITTNSQYGFPIGYGDLLNNDIILTNKIFKKEVLVCFNNTHEKISILDNRFKLVNSTNNLLYFSDSYLKHRAKTLNYKLKNNQFFYLKILEHH